MKALFFDSETGGLNPEKHSIFSVGGLVGDIDTGEIIETFEAFHRLPKVSDYVFDGSAIEIHGITPGMAWEKGISTQEIADKFMDLWMSHGAAILGGHNVSYDVRMFAHQIYKIKPHEFESNFTYRYLDTLPLIRLMAGNEEIKSGSSLKQAIKLMNIDMSEFGKNKFHAALFDSVCSFKIAHKFRKVLLEPSVLERLTT